VTHRSFGDEILDLVAAAEAAAVADGDLVGAERLAELRDQLGLAHGNATSA
jgi:hypothetical protein